MDVICVDFETEAIVGNPIVTPPHSIGCAVWVPGDEPTYYSWGSKHNDNNITYGDFHDYLTRIRDSGYPLLFHNAGFDISVWNNDFCNARLSWLNNGWRLVHDTLFLLFLADPYASTFSLKPSADRWLGVAPTEQNAVKDWVLAHVPRATAKTFGAYICDVPVSLVGPYAIGDVVRTRNLFDLLHKQIVEQGMEPAYDRERRLLPILMDGTKRGIRIDSESLNHDLAIYEISAQAVDEQLSRIFGGTSWLDSDQCMADALERCGAVTSWVLTAKSGKRSMAKDNIKVERPDVKVLLDYRSNLQTCLQTFMRPWAAYSAPDGRLHPNWNQVRQARNDYSTKGARTGRLSSDSPNFQNVPTEFVDPTGTALPVPPGLAVLPQLRKFCLPEVGHVWLKRDFSSQEIRILAHFEDGSLCQAYRVEPNLDPHQMAVELIQQMIGITYARKSIKITGFSIIYGSGAAGLASQLGTAVESARAIKSAYMDAMPGVRNLMYDVQSRGKRGEAIRTWGGRLYLAEPSKLIDGQWRDFAYKLLNYLIQGSAADQTKESLNEWEAARKWDAVFLATVHDEINISVPIDAIHSHMATLKLAMDADRLDVPMRSEGFYGCNWADLKEYNDLES